MEVKMKNLRAFVLCLFPIVLAGLAAEGCKKDTTVAPPPKQEPKDPRTYTWTIDTLQHPESFQTMMMRIWGSDPKNVYVVGHNDVGKRKMYHYNGERWEVVPLTQNEGGPIERPNLSDIFGFGPSNIYAVGDRPIANPNPPPNTIFASLIIRFDGAQWRDIPTSGLFLQAIAGNSSGLAYAAGGGNVGFVITGSMVTPDTIPNTCGVSGEHGCGYVDWRSVRERDHTGQLQFQVPFPISPLQRRVEDSRFGNHPARFSGEQMGIREVLVFYMGKAVLSLWRSVYLEWICMEQDPGQRNRSIRR